MNNNYDMLDALNIAKNHVGYSEKKVIMLLKNLNNIFGLTRKNLQNII